MFLFFFFEEEDGIRYLVRSRGLGDVDKRQASGWEKGQIENQVGNVREWLFTPKACFESFVALNDWLATRCRELAERKHPVEATRTIADCFLQEGHSLRAITSAFDGYVEQMMRVSSTCLIRVERNRYSVPAGFAGKVAVSYTHLRAHETVLDLVCRLLLEKKKKDRKKNKNNKKTKKKKKENRLTRSKVIR